MIDLFQRSALKPPEASLPSLVSPIDMDFFPPEILVRSSNQVIPIDSHNTQGLSINPIGVNRLRMPQIIHFVPPTHPHPGVSCSVRIILLINERGHVTDAYSTDDESACFISASIDAARQWRFTPPVTVRGDPQLFLWQGTISYGK